MSKGCFRSQKTCIYLFNTLGDSFSQSAGDKGSAYEEGIRRYRAAKYNGSHIKEARTSEKKPSSWSVCTTERRYHLFLNTVIAHDTCIYFSSLTHTGAAALLVWKGNLWAPALIRMMPHTSRLWLGCQCDKSVQKGKMTGWERDRGKETVSVQQH